MQRVRPEEFVRWNETMALRYDVDDFHNHPSALVRWVAARRVAGVVALIDPQTDDRILEVGCGAGHVLQKMQPSSLFGLELSPTLIGRARQRLPEKVCLQRANAESMPFSNQIFDKVYCTEVLEHVLDPRKVLGEINRIVKPGGTVVISIPHEKIINACKALLVKIGLFKKILHRQGSNYTMSANMEDEWHLWEFSLKFLREIAPINWQETRALGVPLPILPLGYVVQFKVTA